MLNNSQKRRLRSLAHARRPFVIVGDNGLTQATLNEIDLSLNHHELIKVRIQAADRHNRAAVVEQLCQALGTELIQKIGHIAVLFRPNAEVPGIQLP